MKPPQSLHYIPCQTETSIAEAGREREEQVNKQEEEEEEGLPVQRL